MFNVEQKRNEILMRIDYLQMRMRDESGVSPQFIVDAWSDEVMRLRSLVNELEKSD